MKLSVRCTRQDDCTYGFDFTAAGASYRGTVTIAMKDGTPSKLNVTYVEPRNEVITEKMREAFDPFVIEAILRELTSIQG